MATGSAAELAEADLAYIPRAEGGAEVVKWRHGVIVGPVDEARLNTLRRNVTAEGGRILVIERERGPGWTRPPSEEEIARVRRYECSIRGHTFDVICEAGWDDPREILCSNCGKGWTVERDA